MGQQCYQIGGKVVRIRWYTIVPLCGCLFGSCDVILFLFLVTGGGGLFLSAAYMIMSNSSMINNAVIGLTPGASSGGAMLAHFSRAISFITMTFNHFHQNEIRTCSNMHYGVNGNARGAALVLYTRNFLQIQWSLTVTQSLVRVMFIACISTRSFIIFII
jgi:hypothetical protein